MTAVWLIPTPQGFLLLGYVIAGLLFYSVGAHVPQLRRVVVVTVIGVVVGVVGTLLGPEIWQAAIGAALAVAGPAAAGRLVAHQRAQTARLRELTGRWCASGPPRNVRCSPRSAHASRGSCTTSSATR